ncbi:hypothetical protein RJ639_015932 [Escallonia herrerae]|uniref:Retrotransposon gag domain-containing protein n=1 Tax=Escallonia herrerae TaxID=1293975 RepID=A0AA88VEK6_9ASTE|nr:hypothetical protein RJ639_015932 [Escallonia herrerae]
MAVAPPSTHHSHIDPVTFVFISPPDQVTATNTEQRPIRLTIPNRRAETTQPGVDHVIDVIHQLKTVPTPLLNRSPELRPLEDLSTGRGRLSLVPENWTPGRWSPRYHSPERSPPRDESRYPLSEAIEKAKLPPNIRMLQCDLYDRTEDPGEYVYQFETNMLLFQVSDAVMCRAFPTNLRKAAHAWFKSLQPRSIYSFVQLLDLFQKHFVSSRSRRKNSASLLNIVQEKNESLACFLGRFNVATLEIDNLDESVKYIAFIRGLRPTSKFAFSVNKSPPGNMKALLEKANKYIQAEEYLKTHKGRHKEGKEE